MRKAMAALLAGLIGFQPAGALAQSGQEGAAASFDALGVSLERIKRGIHTLPSPDRADTSPLKLDYYVEVMALAPEIQLFTPEDFRVDGPLAGAPPTHREMVRDMWTRPEFKSPSVPIGSLAIMGIMKLAQWQAGQVKKRRAEDERRKREEELKKKYPDLVVK